MLLITTHVLPIIVDLFFPLFERDVVVPELESAPRLWPGEFWLAVPTVLVLWEAQDCSLIALGYCTRTRPVPWDQWTIAAGCLITIASWGDLIGLPSSQYSLESIWRADWPALVSHTAAERALLTNSSPDAVWRLYGIVLSRAWGAHLHQQQSDQRWHGDTIRAAENERA